MGTAGSYSFAFGPLVALVVVGLLALVLRWAAPGPGRARARRTSAAQQPAPPRTAREEYGLLLPVAAPTSDDSAQRARRQLQAHGIRATVARAPDGAQVMVFAEDLRRAQAVLR